MSGGSADLSPLHDAQAWDVVILSGNTSPGIVDVECDREYEWDKKKGKGVKGGTSTMTGTPQPQIKLTFTLVIGFDWMGNPIDQVAEWGRFVPLLKYDPSKSKAQNALTIYHPSLADIDVNCVVTTKIGNLRHKGKGEYEVTVMLDEFQQPVAQLGTPTGATSFASINPRPFTAPAPSLTLDQQLAASQAQLAAAQAALPP